MDKDGKAMLYCYRKSADKWEQEAAMTTNLMDFLFHPAVMAVVLVCFALIALRFVLKKWQPSRTMRIILGVVSVICILYVALIAVASIGFGQPIPPAADPVMPA